jgi:hypothetical protein
MVLAFPFPVVATFGAGGSVEKKQARSAKRFSCRHPSSKLQRLITAQIGDSMIISLKKLLRLDTLLLPACLNIAVCVKLVNTPRFDTQRLHQN